MTGVFSDLFGWIVFKVLIISVFTLVVLLSYLQFARKVNIDEFFSPVFAFLSVPLAVVIGLYIVRNAGLLIEVSLFLISLFILAYLLLRKNRTDG